MIIDISKINPKNLYSYQQIKNIYGFDVSIMHAKAFNMFIAISDNEKVTEHCKEIINAIEGHIQVKSKVNGIIYDINQIYSDFLLNTGDNKLNHFIRTEINKRSVPICNALKYNFDAAMTRYFIETGDDHRTVNDFASIIFRLYLMKNYRDKVLVDATIEMYRKMYSVIFATATNLEKDDGSLHATDTMKEIPINSFYGKYKNGTILKKDGNNIIQIDLTELYDNFVPELSNFPSNIHLRSLFDEKLIKSVKFNVDTSKRAKEKIVTVELDSNKLIHLEYGLTNKNNNIYVKHKLDDVKNSNAEEFRYVPINDCFDEKMVKEYKFYIPTKRLNDRRPYIVAKHWEEIGIKFIKDENDKGYLVDKIYYPINISFLIEGNFLNDTPNDFIPPFMTLINATALSHYYIGKIELKCFIELNINNKNGSKHLLNSWINDGVKLIDAGTFEWIPSVAECGYKYEAFEGPTWYNPNKKHEIIEKVWYQDSQNGTAKPIITDKINFKDPRIKKTFFDTIDRVSPFKFTEKQKEKFLKFIEEDLNKEEK